MGQYGRWIGPIQSSARWRRKREADNHEGFKLSGDSNLLFWQNCCGLGRDSRGEKFRGAEPLGTKKTKQVYTFPTWIIRWKRQAWWTVEPVWQMSSLDRSTLGWSLPPAQLMAPWVMKYLLIIHFFCSFSIRCSLHRWEYMRLRMSWTCLSGVLGRFYLFLKFARKDDSSLPCSFGFTLNGNLKVNNYSWSCS